MLISLACAALALAACSGRGQNEATNASFPATNAPEPAPAIDAAPYLPTPGSHPARAMALSVPAEAEALAARITSAIRAHGDWYRTYAAQHPDGELPWHPNLGVSEADYRRFQELTGQIALREVGRVTLGVTRRPDGGLALTASGPAAPLDGIILYPERGRVETPLGRLDHGAATANRMARSPTGPWDGVRWTNAGSGAPRRLALSFGRRAAGDMLVFYDYGPSDAETVILLYPAAGPPPSAR